MDQRRSQDRPRYEPIRLRSLWVGMAVIVLFGVPFYLPPGTTHPMVLGVPHWMAISVVSTLLFAALTSWICLRRWNIDEPEEEAGGGA